MFTSNVRCKMRGTPGRCEAGWHRVTWAPRGPYGARRWRGTLGKRKGGRKRAPRTDDGLPRTSSTPVHPMGTAWRGELPHCMPDRRSSSPACSVGRERADHAVLGADVHVNGVSCGRAGDGRAHVRGSLFSTFSSIPGTSEVARGFVVGLGGVSPGWRRVHTDHRVPVGRHAGGDGDDGSTERGLSLPQLVQPLAADLTYSAGAHVPKLL